MEKSSKPSYKDDDYMDESDEEDEAEWLWLLSISLLYNIRLKSKEINLEKIAIKLYTH